MNMKIRDIVQRNAGSFTCYEIAYRPRRYCHPDEIKSIFLSDAGELIPNLRPDIDIQDMWAYDSESLGETEYNATFPGDWDFDELYGDADAKVLVIWLTHMSYEILTNPEIRMVRDFRLDNLGQFHDYYVVKPIRKRSQRNDDLWDDEYEYYSDDEDYMGSADPTEEYQVCKGMKEQLDRLYAREGILIPADDLGVNYDLILEDAWWLDETPLEHYGTEDAKILLIVLV